MLNEKELEMVSEIVEDKSTKEKEADKQMAEELNRKYEELSKAIEELRLGRGYASFL